MTIIASCGDTLAPGEETVSVRYRSETCDAIEGFKPCIIHAEFCPACALEASSWPEFIPPEEEAA